MKFFIYRRMKETDKSMNYLASYLASNNTHTKNLWNSVKNAISTGSGGCGSGIEHVLISKDRWFNCPGLLVLGQDTKPQTAPDVLAATAISV